jgi:hypothetical protein
MDNRKLAELIIAAIGALVSMAKAIVSFIGYLEKINKQTSASMA